MTRRWLGYFGLLPWLTSTKAHAAGDELLENILDFHFAWDKFVRTYFGCPPSALTSAECQQALGKLDRKLYEKVRAKAKTLFDFGEKK